MITPYEFYVSTLGNTYENDGVPAGDPVQCADYFKEATKQVLGKTWPAGGDGYVDNFWYNRQAHANEFEFVQYPNYKNGDFVVWANSSRDADSPFSLSHIAMYWDGKMVGQNQFGHKEVTDPWQSDDIWRRSLGGMRFKAWAGSEPVVDKYKMRGCDISEHNSLDTPIEQYDYVIIRASWGTNKDKKAEIFRQKCETLGIPYGVYCYSYALDATGAAEEAEFLLDIIKDWNVQCGVWFDMEDADHYKERQGALNTLVCTTACQTFCQAIQDAGYYTGIYASQSWFGSYIVGCDKWDKWVASWGTNDGTIQRDTSSLGTMLQYTSHGGLDKDISYVELPHYRSYPVHQTQPAPEPTPVPENPPAVEPVDISVPTEPVTLPVEDVKYLFKMSNRTYDLLKFITNVVVPLLIQFYSSIYDVLPGGPQPITIAKVASAFIILMNGILSYSSAGYNNAKNED